MVERAGAFLRDLKAAWRSLGRAKGLTATVVLLGAAVTASAIPAMRAAVWTWCRRCCRSSTQLLIVND